MSPIFVISDIKYTNDNWTIFRSVICLFLISCREMTELLLILTWTGMSINSCQVSMNIDNGRESRKTVTNYDQ